MKSAFKWKKIRAGFYELDRYHWIYRRSKRKWHASAKFAFDLVSSMKKAKAFVENNHVGKCGE